MSDAGSPVRPGDLPEPSPEWSLELLADLRAGALTERAAAQLWSRAAADPHACAMLAALDATVADLAALPTRCPTRMPDAVARRLDAALAAEVQRADRHPPRLPDPVRTAHHRGASEQPGIMPAVRRLRARWVAAGVLAAAVTGVAVSGAMTGVLTGDARRADDALGAAAVAPPVPLALSSGDLGGVLEHALGARDYGALSRPEALRRCLDANDVPVRDGPLGAREVTLDGRRGVLLVLPTTRLNQFRLLVVGPGCGPANPARMADGVTSR